MTTAQAVETSVTVNNNSPIQDYVHPDDQTQAIFESSYELQMQKTDKIIVKLLFISRFGVRSFQNHNGNNINMKCMKYCNENLPDLLIDHIFFYLNS